MSTADWGRKAFGWFDERYGVAPLIDFAKKKEVPLGLHSMVWYFLGGSALFFLVVQVSTGVLLLMYYQPGEATAHESIRFITTQVPFGWLVRSMHCWSSHLMIAALVVHMFSVMFLKAYRPPRELTWVTGILLFGVALTFGFSGYLLPWNELAYFATAVGTDSVKSVPVIGEWLLTVMRGGPEVSINTLYRFFGLHVVILPLIIAGLLGVHLACVQRQGMALPVGHDESPRSMRFFPNFVLRDVLLWLCCLMVLVTLSLLLPYGPGVPGIDWELGLKADPLAPAYPGIKPEWYFLWVYQLLREFPPHVGFLEGPQAALLLVNALAGVWALLPWLDRRARRGEASPGFTDFGVAVLLVVGWLTLKAWDIGGGGAETPDAQAVAWTTGWITLGLTLGITLCRALVFRHRWFLLSAATVVHVVLHGLMGFSYLTAGYVASGLAIIALVVATRRAPAGAAS